VSASDKINSNELLSVWNHSPLVAGLIALGVGFALVNLLMVPEGHFGRGRWLNFLTNNGVLIPLYVAMVTVVLHRADPSDAWYTSGTWHKLCVVLPVVGWIVLDWRNYEIGQLITPSKLGHTLAVIPIAYWLIAPAPVLFASFKPGWAVVVALLAAAGALYFWVGPQAGKIVYPTRDMADPHVKRENGTFRPVYKERLRQH
jgi:hypothetical protein